MGMLDTEITQELTRNIEREILPALPMQMDVLSSTSVEAFRSKLHVLHYYCLRKGVSPDIVAGVKSALETSKVFWEFLEDNANVLADLKDTHRMRWLDLSSGVLAELEEIMSGEETVRDIVVNAIAIFLAWKSDSVWVDMAKTDQKIAVKTYAVGLRDELWNLIIDSSKDIADVTLKKSAEIGEKIDLLLRFVSTDQMPPLARFVLLAQIYILLLKLKVGRILLSIKTNSQEP